MFRFVRREDGRLRGFERLTDESISKALRREILNYLMNNCTNLYKFNQPPMTLDFS